ncbi:MAG: hypothetical protein LBO74_10790 [Candidatus Symbiothrix sp.]|nr:hypothetical protein [Candidatus Symbiothrix sp.]
MIRKILFSLVILFGATVSMAQEVTTMWPYIYSDFQKGTVYFKDQQILEAPVNVHLLKSTLHYLDKDQIREAETLDIVLVQIGYNKYYMRNNRLMHVLAGDSIGFVAELVTADFNRLTESGGAYGSSSNVQATRKLSSLEIGGVNITNHVELKSKKDAGSLLPLTKKYFIVTEDQVYPANKKGFESQLPDNKRDAFKKFIKQNKIKWNHPDSLIALLDFLKD